MAEIIEGKKIAQEILADLSAKISQLKTAGIAPRLIVVLVGRNPASLAYIKMKQKAAEEIGLIVEVHDFPENVSEPELLEAIWAFNQMPGVCGILIQLPLPPHLHKQMILDAVLPELDVDCLTTTNKSRLINNQEVLYVPPAAAAVLRILEYYHLDLKSLNILVVGSGDLVGKPLAALFLNRGVNFHLANRFTENLPALARQADVIITGVGRPGLLTGDLVKAGAAVVDAGTTGSESGDVRGDVEVASVAIKARLLAPVPGGVGPVTVAMLMGNVVKSAEQKLSGRGI